MDRRQIRVAIWDDRPEQLASLRRDVDRAIEGNSGVEIVNFDEASIKAGVEWLESMFDSKGVASDGSLSSIDVLCIDYDLRAIEKHSWLTADTLAGLVRAFTECPCVVVLNRPPRVAFDLTLVGAWEGPGDLQLLPGLLGRPVFWGAETEARKESELVFKPWHWLDLFAVRGQTQAKLDALEKYGPDLADMDIFAFLEFPDEVRSRLSWRALGALSNAIASDDPRLTFESFIKNGARCLLPERFEQISIRDDASRPVALRIIAFELGRWVREQVVAGQDVLVDLPHLIARAPWLFKGSQLDRSAWNRLAALGGDCFAQGLVPDWLIEYRYARQEWTGREVFLWESLQRDPRFAMSDSDVPEAGFGDFVFAEDCSEFVSMGAARTFIAGFGNLWDQRYVALDPEAGFPYGPLVRFAL